MKYCTAGTPRGIVPRIVQSPWLTQSLRDLRSTTVTAVDGVGLWFAELATLGSLLSSPDDMELLSAAELARANAMQAVDVRRDFLVSRILLRSVLGACLGAVPKSLTFSISEHGKPMLAATAAQGTLHFNISHSRSAWLLGVTRRAPVGIDIETRSHVENSARLASRVFSLTEVTELDSALDRDAAFLRGWTRKEAVLKAAGSGFTWVARDIDVGTGAVHRRVELPARVHSVADVWSFEPPIAGYAAVALLSDAAARPPDRIDDCIVYRRIIAV